jgi:uncharacterized phage-associated protein
MNIRKIVTILNYLSHNVPALTKMKASKLLYFIDKTHFIDFGRFVTFDQYVKMEYGPVPSRILNIINSPEEFILDKDNRKFFFENITISDDKKRMLKGKCKADTDELSKSELLVTDKIIKKYGKFTVGQLVDISHKEFAWQNAGDADYLSVEDMIHGIEESRRKELTVLYHAEKYDNHLLSHIFS